MSKNVVDKKTIISICLTYGIILAVLLVIEFVPGLKYHEKTHREIVLDKYAALDDPDGYGDMIFENQEFYSDEILDVFDFSDYYYRLESIRQETLHFIYDYPMHKDDYKTMQFTDEEINSTEVPALYMFDRRWGYEKMGGISIKSSGCAVAALEMAYLYLTHDTSLDPVKIGKIAEENKYLAVLGGLEQNNITSLANDIGLNAVEYNYWNDDVKEDLEKNLKAALDKEDTVVLAGMTGDTFGGHAIIIRGYDENGYYINDPNSTENTEKTWDFDVFRNELIGFWELTA